MFIEKKILLTFYSFIPQNVIVTTYYQLRASINNFKH